MIGAIVMIFTVIWVYQSAVKAKTGNAIMWVGITGAVFLVSQVFLYFLNIDLSDAFNGKDISTEGYERELTSIGDRKNEEGFQSFSGVLLSVFLELMPPVMGFLIVAVIRLKFITKEQFSAATLFGGTKELLFGGVKNIVDTLKQGVKKS
ncbi:MAG: hypothetical protein PHR16_05915 [Methylovulum sp.]|nr:hypothetical protein [Methylovulum sp.]